MLALREIADTWASIYSNSAALRSGVSFAHLGGLVASAGPAIAADRALLRATTTEIARLEHRIAFLATTASITPYIGLFGTVWGIMTAFQEIAGAGSTSLGVVAPPIAEALVATALGLFAAIPAVYFYNDLTSRVKAFANEMEDFSLEFLTIAERNFT